MQRRRFTDVIWAITFVLHLLIIFAAVRRLPNIVASNFTLSGKPASFLSKETLLTLQLFIAVFTNGLLFAIHRRLVKKSGWKWLNIPWKNSWAASEAKMNQALDLTRIFLARTGIVLNTVISLSVLMIIQWNVDGPFYLSVLQYLLVSFSMLAITLGWGIYEYWPKKR